MGVGEPIGIDLADAVMLRDALRRERLATEALERVTLEHRIALHSARAERGALLDSLADQYGFDSTAEHSFDFGLRTITRKA